jgi:hypothetical protein
MLKCPQCVRPCTRDGVSGYIHWPDLLPFDLQPSTYTNASLALGPPSCGFSSDIKAFSADVLSWAVAAASTS